MLAPLSWLRDFAPFELDAVALGEVFDDLGMVVEAINRVGEGLEDVVVARVEAIEAIPGADKIRKVTVDAGTDVPLQIVCGAWNFHVGDSIPLAPVGAVLPGGFEIGRRKMKGVASEGMLCSARELGLGDDAAGLLVLAGDHPPGEPITEALGITADVVYDLAIEANRPDANCIAGVARDAAARLHLPFALPPFVFDAPRGGFDVRVTSPDLCDRFTATVFRGVRVGPSPDWVTRRLTLAGMRPITNVVDASNYVMLELGQPTHAYDLDRLPSAALGARAARPGERVATLDDVVRTLGDGIQPDCVIVDGDDRPIGIAGIMGGASSEVHDGTTSVVLEAAHFVPMAIARSSKRLGLRSEASARFERGVDIEGIERSIARFSELLTETCPGVSWADGTVDWRAPVDPPPPISVRIDRLNAVLGVDLGADEITALLQPIGFAVSAPAGGALRVTVPTYRPDAVAEIDVIEEVARHHGYAKIPRTTTRPAQVGRLTGVQRTRRLVREILAGAGVSEAMTGPLLGPGDHSRTGLAENGIVASDPLVLEESILRTSLLPGMLRAVAFNADRRNPDARLFEIGHVWPGGEPVPGVAARDATPGRGLPIEQELVAVALAGSDATDAVRVLRRLGLALRLTHGTVRLVAGQTAGLHPTRTATVVVDGVAAGWVGEVDPGVVEAWGISGRVGWLEVELGGLNAAREADDATARPVSRFPSSDLDLAFVVPDQVPAASVAETLEVAAGEVLEWLALFDVYRGPGVAPDARSLAFRLRFASQDRTLTDGDLAEVRGACIDAVVRAHGAVLRG
ncbi:MAG: phenylalanine--tRNA ligase subunit beta [Acidimicrobiales bacterium]